MKLLPFIATLLLAGCTSAPPVFDFDRTQIIDADKDAVWQAAMKFFTSHNLDIETLEKESGVVYARAETALKFVSGASFDGGVAECPSGLGLTLVQAVDRTRVNLLVSEVEDGTSVTINAAFTRNYPPDHMTSKTTCNSNGLLERAIFDFLSGEIETEE